MKKRWSTYLFIFALLMGIGLTRPIDVQAAGSYTSITAENVTANNATVRARIAPDTWITSCGLYFGTTTGNMRIVTSESVNKWTNNIWYTAGTDFYYLASSTRYYYKFYFISDGHTYFSDTYSFQTKASPHLEKDHKGYWYNYENGTYAKNCWKIIGGYWYYFGSNGYARTGWAKISGKWYYFNPSTSRMQKGMIYISGCYYYLSSSGAMCTGWQKINGYWYYFNSSGARRHGWCSIGGKWYYLSSSGVMQTGWKCIGGKYYYMVSSGEMCTGWKRIGNYWYCFSSQGVRRTGWYKSSGKWYYLNSSGVMKIGWVCVSGNYYYMNGSGEMCTGWRKVSGCWYYLRSSGVMAKNTCVGGYYLANSGKMLEGSASQSDINYARTFLNYLGKSLSYLRSQLGTPDSTQYNIYQYNERYLWNEPATIKIDVPYGTSTIAQNLKTFGSLTSQKNAYFERLYSAMYAVKEKPTRAVLKPNGDIFIHWRTSNPKCVYMSKSSTYVEILTQVEHDHCD